MTDQLNSIMAEFEQEANEASRFCYAARAREVQVDAVERLEAMKNKVSSSKADMIARRDEDAANQLLGLEKMLWALICELKMWISFKDDDPHSAWTWSIRAQDSARTAMRAHEITRESMEQYLSRLFLLEQFLFPPQIFVSPGMVIKSSLCSVCGSEYGDCDHIKGQPYMGEMCSRIITEYIAREISVVPMPANKHARMLIISDGQATRDILTWRTLPDPEPGEDRSEWIRKQVLKESSA